MKKILLFIAFIPLIAIGQNIKVRGTVLENKDALIGVNIVEKGTTNGTTSDFNGNYELNITSKNAVLVFSYISYKTQEIRVENGVTTNVNMVPDSQSLNAVVVKGFGGIIGKARKRTESIQNIPESVTALNSEGIENAGINNIESFAKIVPNLKLSNTQAAGINFLTVRGIPQIRNGDAPVAFVIDGVTVPDPSLLNQELFDLALIEVVKGPQGALYGKNAIGGAINIYSKEPTNKSKNSFKIGYGNANSYLGQFVSSGAIKADKIFYRLSTQYKNYDGLIDNITLNKKADFSKEFTTRGQIIARVTDNFKASATVQYINTKAGATYYSVNPYGNLFPESGNPEPGGPLSPNPKKGNNVIAGDEPGKSALKNFFTSLNLEYSLNTVKLQSITSYNHVDRSLSGDLDFTHYNDFTQGEAAKTKTFNQEIRLHNSNTNSKLNWSAGAFYQNIEKPFFQDGTSRDFAQYEANGFVRLDSQLYYAVSADVVNHTDTFSFFGFTDYLLTDKLTASAGFRYDFDTFKQVDNLFNTTSKRSNNVFQPKVSLSYKASQTTLIYVNYGRGYRTGGFNPAATTRFNRQYKDELTDNYELGFKTSWWNNRFVLNGSMFYTDFTNQQQYAYDLETFFAGNYNYEKSSIKGFEIDTKLRLSNHFDLLSGFGLVNSRIKEGGITGTEVAAPPTNLNTFNGNRTPFVPVNNFNIGLDSNFAINEKLDFNANVNLSGTGETYWFEDNMAKSNAYQLLDARATLSINKNLKITIWGTNILNKQYYLEYYSGAQFGGTDDFGWRGRPATYGASLSINL